MGRGLRRGRRDAGVNKGKMALFKQLNLNHCVAATAMVGRDSEECVYLLQEPWYNAKGNVGLPSRGNYYAALKSRAGIYVNAGVSAIPINDFTGNDISTVLLEGGPLKKPLIVCSVYLANNDDPVLPMWERLVQFCTDKNKPLICGIDSNTHSTFWNMPPKTNSESRRADKLEEFIVMNDLTVHNRGETATFVRPHLNQATIIDITLSLNMRSQISGWKVMETATASDHRLISFRVLDVRNAPKTEVRNYSKANWGRFQSGLRKYEPPRTTEWSERDIEDELSRMYDAVDNALDAACPKVKVKERQSYAWWNEECETAHAKYKIAEKRYFKRPSRNRFPDMWEELKGLRRELTYAIKRSKRDSWRKLVGQVEGMSEMARLNKIIGEKENQKVGLLSRGDGSTTTNTAETLQVLMNEHFPGNVPVGRHPPPKTDKVTLEEIDWISDERVNQAIEKFDSHKAAGPDGLKPIVLKNFPSKIITTLVLIYTACLSLGYTPTAWRESIASFIPKPKKGDYTKPRAFRPISLMSFLFKTLERLVCWHNDETAFKENPLHSRQYAFRKGYSTERAMSDALQIIEKGVYNAQYTVGIFLDIKGAFDNITTNAIVKALERKQVDSNIIKWYRQYLDNRICMAELGQSKRRVKLTKGAPQGGVASPVLAWNCAFDALLEMFDGLATRIIGYADDALLLTTGFNINTVVEIAQSAVRKAEKWASEIGVEFSAEKTAVIIFTRRKGKPNKKIKIYGQEVEYVTSTKYLGVIFDDKLTFRKHVEEKIAAARKALYRAKKAFSRTWGPQPKRVKWLYTGVLRPALTYGSIVWHTAVDTNTIKDKLTRLQRLALLTMANVRRATPTAALEIILDLPPLDLIIKETAAKAFVRLNCNAHMYAAESHINKIKKWLGKWEYAKSDNAETFKLFGRKFQTTISDGKDNDARNDNIIRCYTDGSRLNGSAGAGVAIFDGPNLEHTMKLNMGNRSVFQAEVQAVRMAAEFLEGLYKRQIIFRIDNQAAIKALGANETRSKLAHDTFDVLQTLSQNNEVTLQWIKAHAGWPGNELADDLAKEGTKLPQQEDTTLPPRRELWNAIEAVTYKKWAKRWLGLKTCRQTKYFYLGPDKGKSNEILKLNRAEISLLIRFLTGHAFLRRHEYIVAYGVYPPTGWAMCSLCDEDEETPHHLITRCPALVQRRLEFLGERILTETPVWRPKPLAQFLEGKVASLETN